jgi:hypothetical protein
LLGRRGVVVGDGERIRVTSFIDTAPHGRSGGVPDRDLSAVARRRSVPTGMHPGAARLQLNRLPREWIAARPPWGIGATFTGGIAARWTRGMEGRRTVLRARTTAPLGRISRGGGPGAVRQRRRRPVPRSYGGSRQLGGCLCGPSIDSIEAAKGPERCEPRSDRTKHPGRKFEARSTLYLCHPRVVNGYKLGDNIEIS